MMKRVNAFSLVLLSMAIGCSSGETSEASQADMRDGRYCEVLLGYLEGTGVRMDVYNTWGFNDCPQQAWEALDAAAIQAEHGAMAVLLNGPRHWTMNNMEGSSRISDDPVAFGDIDMSLAGILTLSPMSLQSPQPYTNQTVARMTTYTFLSGNQVYELVNPSGQIYVMQSYSLEVDPSLTMEALADLGSRLTLPQGWSYRSRELTENLYVEAIDGKATVIRDDLGNTYQLSQQ